jgi:hypothetical protein
MAAASLLALFKVISDSEPAVAWLGALLAAAAPLCWLGLGRMGRAENRDWHPLGFTLASSLGVAVVMSSAWRFGPVADPALLLAGASLMAWFVYLRWIRKGTTTKTGEGSST